MIYRAQTILGVMLIVFGAQQDFWVYGVGSVALGIALLSPMVWWRKKTRQPIGVPHSRAPTG